MHTVKPNSLKLSPMKLSKLERERHHGAAVDLIARLEQRLASGPPAKHKSPQDVFVAERVGQCKQQLAAGLKDRELMQLNLELADLFYRSNNADKRRRLQLH